MNPQRLGMLSAGIAALAWGGMFPVLSHLLTFYDPFWLTSIRYVVATSILALALWLIEGRKAFRLEGRGWHLAVLGTMFIAFFNIFVLSGQKTAGPEHCGLIVALAPLMTTLIVWARTRQRPALVTFCAMLLAIAGLFCVVTKGHPATLLASGAPLGDLSIAVGVSGVAVYTAFSASFAHWSRLRLTTITLTFGTLATVAATLVATAFGVAHVPSHIDTTLVLDMGYMIVVAAIVAMLTWNNAILKLGPQNAALFLNLVPVVTFAITFVMGHRFSMIEYGGAGLTIVALIINNLATRVTSWRQLATSWFLHLRILKSN